MRFNKPKEFRPVIWIAIILCLLVASSCTFNKRQIPLSPDVSERQGPLPPDISECTRIELKLLPTAYEYLNPTKTPNTFNQEEISYLESLDWITVKDTQRIKKLAGYIQKRWGERIDPFSEGFPLGSIRRCQFRCYRDDMLMTAFTIVNESRLHRVNGWRFTYGSPIRIVPWLLPDLEPFRQRLICGFHMGKLRTGIVRYYSNKGNYPTPSRWCSEVLDEYNQFYFYASELRPRRDKMLEWFTCPGGGKGECHFAMNAHCTSSSPGDTVLLFESEGGWNQYGGPELCTLDHHDPQGSWILLKGGYIKFVRTKEEIEQLRWE